MLRIRSAWQKADVVPVMRDNPSADRWISQETDPYGNVTDVIDSNQRENNDARNVRVFVVAFYAELTLALLRPITEIILSNG